MEYGEIPPHPLLRPFVRTYWWLRGPSTDAAPQPVMPDGTTELIVHRGRPFWRYLADDRAFDFAQARAFDFAQARALQAPMLFAGQMHAPAIIHPDGEADVVSVRFAPHGAFALLGIPQHALADQIADATSLGLPWLSSALRRSRAAETRDSAIRHLEAALLGRLTSRTIAGTAARSVTAAVRLLDANSGRMLIEDVAGRTGSSRRQLERWFVTSVGMTPKAYARVIRFQTAASRLAAEPVAPLVHVSTDAGYFDQSHMIRDFLSFAGKSPSDFRRQLGDLTSLMLRRSD